MTYKIILVAGARPNFMKIAPLMHALKESELLSPILVHTGQHYDQKMSDLFFEQLNIPEPDVNLGIGSASHAIQTARIMEAFEKVCLDLSPDMVLVVGDVNSTVACTLVASKLNIKTIHYEAGLRSRDRSMPEEINRLVTDSISDIFFTTSQDANENLIAEGIPKEKIFMVGNLMIDSVTYSLSRLQDNEYKFKLLNRDKVIQSNVDFKKGTYGLMTFHRPINVDFVDALKKLVDSCEELSVNLPLIFPIHPRTYKNLQDFGLLSRLNGINNLFLIEPLGYFEFLGLMKDAKFVLTDSGGVQEETTFLGIPCLTVRPNTERPITITEGTNRLIKLSDIVPAVEDILSEIIMDKRKPKYWDGNTAKRIKAILELIVKEKKPPVKVNM